ncbi:MAG: CDP-glucose 4,6-dehydratase [Desulfobulbaceae bacterium]|nr:CDP-glucose 4,6-dehydratase [Desulfobulbaceae bacterium]
MISMFSNIYNGRRVFVTGHTGFKGSWLALWLRQLGANIVGYALSPETTPNHWKLLGLQVEDRRHDIRDVGDITRVMEETQPEIVFHLAAQPLVRRSYHQPLETFSTNVMGTANVLDACRYTDSVRAIVVITTDKCYENREWAWGYREIDRLGGHDPYSASKAGAELVAASYRSSFFYSPESPLLATARAGNVIGGGDWSEDRLIPDLVRAISAGNSLEIRSPYATRPWQHVLEPLCGYLMLGEKLLQGRTEYAEAWNFGPDTEGNRTVSEVLTNLQCHWPNIQWHLAGSSQLHEAGMLYLDNAKARQLLKWKPLWQFDDAIAATSDWYRIWLETGQVDSRRQLDEYIEMAIRCDAAWVGV